LSYLVGFSLATLRDGNQYIREFKDGQMNGQGALTFVNGIIEEGIWENNIYLGKNKDCKTPRIFGNLTICLPDVKGMIECYSDPIFKNSIDKIAAANPGQIPIASYIEGNSYDNIYTSLILNKGLGEYPWISVFSIEQLKNKAVIQDDIRKMANSLSETFDDYDFRKINEKLSKSIPYYNFKIDQPVLLERYITNSKIESLMSIIKYYNDGVEIYELSIMNFLIIDNRCILYTYYDRYKGQKTIDNLKAKNDYFGLYLIQENK
jgi:hypothetical protein